MKYSGQNKGFTQKKQKHLTGVQCFSIISYLFLRRELWFSPLFLLMLLCLLNVGSFRIFEHKKNKMHMNTANSSKNGLPKELNNIPLGQVFVLTNPYLGITPGDILTMQFIFSMSRQYGQYRVVNTIPVEYSDLWNCCICKVQTMQGVQLLVADNGSLVEMLCEFWGLDYDTVRKDIKLPTRYKVMGIDGEKGPRRFNLADSDHQESGTTTRLEFLQTYSREKTLGDIRASLLDNINHNFGITLEEIVALYKSVNNDRKEYRLEIHIEPESKSKSNSKFKKCDICLIDNAGEVYKLDLEVYCKALYLTFLTFKKGLSIKEISGNDEFFKRLQKIYLQLPYSSASKTPQKFDTWEDNSQYTLFLQKIGKIRDAIMKATKDNKVRELYAVEGDKGSQFGIAGATDENRALVIKKFGLK